ncbi:MAG: hypothetical protein AAB740_00240 [Patescibacteria group bacterium]
MIINCKIGSKEFFIEKPERVPSMPGFPENFGVVIEGALYRGASPLAEHLDALKGLLIKEIISLYSLSSESQQIAELISSLQTGEFQHKLYNTDLGESVFLEAARYVVKRAKETAIYLHCAGGSNRTGQVVILVKLFLGRNNMVELLTEAIKYGFGWQNTGYCDFLESLIEKLENCKDTALPQQ